VQLQVCLSFTYIDDKTRRTLQNDRSFFDPQKPQHHIPLCCHACSIGAYAMLFMYTFADSSSERLKPLAAAAAAPWNSCTTKRLRLHSHARHTHAETYTVIIHTRVVDALL
jgi:hypothetical protein